MKIEVSDNLFSDLAKKLETTPENVIKVFLDHAKNLPHPVLLNAIQKTSSLDTALEKLLDNAESAYLIGDLIQEIIGEHDYVIEDSGYNLEEGTFWLLANFLEGDKGILDSAHLQFGKNAVIMEMFSIKNLLLEKDYEKFTDDIDEIISQNIREDDYHEFEVDWLEANWASFSISIFTENILDLPKVSVLEKIAQEMMEFFQSHDERTNLK